MAPTCRTVTFHGFQVELLSAIEFHIVPTCHEVTFPYPLALPGTVAAVFAFGPRPLVAADEQLLPDVPVVAVAVAIA